MVRGFFYIAAIGEWGGRGCCDLVVEKQRKQNDDRDRNSQQPKKNTSTPSRLLLLSPGFNVRSDRWFPGTTNENPPAPAPGD
jgi:hypothetical protein